MKKIITALASAACLLCAASAHAGIYKFDFTATDFHPYEGVDPVPQNSITGWITFTADSLGAPVTSINGIDLTIAGHAYTVEEIGAISWSGGTYLFGGIAEDITGIRYQTNDFWVGSTYMTYAVSGAEGFWSSFNVTSTYTEQVADVPEPSSLALLLTGAGGLAALLRRRRR